MDRNIVLTHYDYDKKEEVIDGEVAVNAIAKAIKPDQLGELICDFLNSYSNSYRSGTEAGKVIADNHRTLQGCAVNFMLAALIELANNGTDPRNQSAVQTCQFIRQALKDGTIKYQPFI